MTPALSGWQVLRAPDAAYPYPGWPRRLYGRPDAPPGHTVAGTRLMSLLFCQGGHVIGGEVFLRRNEGEPTLLFGQEVLGWDVSPSPPDPGGTATGLVPRPGHSVCHLLEAEAGTITALLLRGDSRAAAWSQSIDEGLTWGAPAILDWSASELHATGYHVPWGFCASLSGGMLMAAYGMDPAGSGLWADPAQKEAVELLHSSDGIAWSHRSWIVLPSGGAPYGAGETSLVRLPSGRLFAYCGAWSYTRVSDDDGLTWNTLQPWHAAGVNLHGTDAILLDENTVAVFGRVRLPPEYPGSNSLHAGVGVALFDADGLPTLPKPILWSRSEVHSAGGLCTVMAEPSGLALYAMTDLIDLHWWEQRPSVVRASLRIS